MPECILLLQFLFCIMKIKPSLVTIVEIRHSNFTQRTAKPNEYPRVHAHVGFIIKCMQKRCKNHTAENKGLVKRRRPCSMYSQLRTSDARVYWLHLAPKYKYLQCAGVMCVFTSASRVISLTRGVTVACEAMRKWGCAENLVACWYLL